MTVFNLHKFQLICLFLFRLLCDAKISICFREITESASNGALHLCHCYQHRLFVSSLNVVRLPNNSIANVCILKSIQWSACSDQIPRHALRPMRCMHSKTKGICDIRSKHVVCQEIKVRSVAHRMREETKKRI